MYEQVLFLPFFLRVICTDETFELPVRSADSDSNHSSNGESLRIYYVVAIVCLV